jgi:hypothetical protein
MATREEAVRLRDELLGVRAFIQAGERDPALLKRADELFRQLSADLPGNVAGFGQCAHGRTGRAYCPECKTEDRAADLERENVRLREENDELRRKLRP